MKTIGKDVYVADEAFPSVSRAQIDLLKRDLDLSSRGRVRLCIHKNSDEPIHEMFIAFLGRNYVRPSRHLKKDESINVLEGAGDYVFFDETGNITDTVPLGTYSSGDQFYCRIPESADHALFIRSPDAAVQESTVGPFRREDTVFAPWSPEDGDVPGVTRFLNRLEGLPGKDRPRLKLKKRGEGVYVADEPIVSVGKKEIDFLKQECRDKQQTQIALCPYQDTQNALHEMFVVNIGTTYARPNKHPNKDQSFHVLEGEADFILFDDEGKIIATIPLCDYESGRQFYIRVPANVFYTVIMKSDTLVVHEVAHGEYKKSDLIPAPWAPKETDQTGAASFLDRLRSVVWSSSFSLFLGTRLKLELQTGLLGRIAA
jgi:cupin fold WbuC family metalloprotein